MVLHVSTCYCNCNYKTIEEKVYPEIVNWREAIRIAENADDHTLRILTDMLETKLLLINFNKIN